MDQALGPRASLPGDWNLSGLYIPDFFLPPMLLFTDTPAQTLSYR